MGSSEGGAVRERRISAQSLAQTQRVCSLPRYTELIAHSRRGRARKCSCAPRSLPPGQSELGRYGPMVGTVERVDRDIADADAMVGKHVVDRSARSRWSLCIPILRWTGL